MLLNQAKVAALAALFAGLALQVPADAAQINVPGTAFHTQFGAGNSIAYFGNVGTSFASGLLTMIAPLPRAPSGGAVTVFVDGLGVTGTYSCTVSSSLASKSFSRSSLFSWTQAVNFTAVELPSSGYLSINCSVPSDGGFFGVTVTG